MRRFLLQINRLVAIILHDDLEVWRCDEAMRRDEQRERR